MGALNPLFLLAGLATAVPVLLHLFQRHETRRFRFPALRYLERTEREHAREIRLRQLLLLLTRVLALLFITGAGARLIFAGRSDSHAPTAVAMVLDNSMSAGMVVGEARVLDQLKALAMDALDQASVDDRFWVIRAGEPWLPAIAGGVTEARAAVEETETSEAAGDLTVAIERAVDLLRTSALPDREIHVLSDLQRTAFELPGRAPAGDLATVVWSGQDGQAENRALVGLLVGSGLPPVAGQRGEVTVRARDTGPDTTRFPVRLVLDGRIRGAGVLSSGSEAVIDLPASPEGWIQGYVDVDPDDLRADDRRYFAYRSRAAPAVYLGGSPSLFLSQALAVLEGSSRLRSSSPADAELILAQDGVGLELRGPETAALVVPPSDVTLLPALDRRLAEAGIPWRFEARTDYGEAELTGALLPSALMGVRALRWFTLVDGGEASTANRVLAEAAGSPWAVDGVDAAGRRYLLLASPLDDGASTLPVSSGMVRFVDWVAGEWAGSGGGLEYAVGSQLPAPDGATQVRFPSGRELDIDATRTVGGTREAGLYTFLAADTVVSVVALNPPPSESDPETLDRGDLATAIGPEVTIVSRPDAWSDSVFRSRLGPEIWWPLLLLAALLLMAESLLASSGPLRTRGREHQPSAV